jgi:ergothioneine biosynthesis protein EgtB
MNAFPRPPAATATSEGTGQTEQGDPLALRFRSVRSQTLALCRNLRPEDTVVQSMPDASPTKWHLAHTTWFFETFILGRDPAYRPVNPAWDFLFNSYYQSIGPMHARPSRGMLTRPTLDEVVDYRRRVDEAMAAVLARGDDPSLAALVELGLQHEQQHQELLLTDIKHAFSLNPLEPAFDPALARPTAGRELPMSYIPGQEGIVEIGHGGDGFAFDNELPRHRALLHPHAIANRPVSNAEFRAFIEDGGYRTPTLWLSEGWSTVQREGWNRPFYWSEDLQSEFTLGGRREVDPHAPVVHVSYFEADAFAHWAGARLPLEAEWEAAAAGVAPRGNFLESGALHPHAASGDDETAMQMFGDVWEWTSSPYVGYPGFRTLPGALGEYNGKFMCGQFVLRGGSCATPLSHIRASYRNFFPPHARWQFMGIRLGSDR